MYRFEKLLVVLSLGENDPSLIKFAKTVASLARSEAVYFLYSREPVEIPDSLKKQYPWMAQPIESAAVAKVQESIQTHFGDVPGCKIHVETSERHPALSALEKIVDLKIDLAFVGGSSEELPTAIKLTRKAPCSVLVAPTDCEGDFSRICLGLDLSNFSNYVLDVGTAFTSAKGLPEIECVTFFKIPYGYQKTNIPRKHLEKDLRDHTSMQLESFISRQNLKGVKANAHVAESHFPGGAIHSVARDKGCDLVIIGCRGKDALTATLLGSNAEDALQSTSINPVLAVKEKGTGLSFVESLLGKKRDGSLF